MSIILDGMGSDNHPNPEIEAAVKFSREYDQELIVVGDKDKLQLLLSSNGKTASKVKIVHAPDVFSMTDKLSGQMLRKAQSSMGVAMDMLKAGEAEAFVTAGNTGGAMAIGLARLGRIRGIKRPALSALFPVKGGNYCVVTDIGANVECKPEYLLQFAVMGSLYAEKILGITNPRVGLLSNGEEAGKGNELVKKTYPILEKSNLNFIGNIEGKELFGGEADVVVMDGFTGNILLKSSEALAKLIMNNLKEYLGASIPTKLGALLAMPAFKRLRMDIDPKEIGAVPLLGLDGLVFVAHGRSGSHALYNSLVLAQKAIDVNLMSSLRETISNKISDL